MVGGAVGVGVGGISVVASYIVAPEAVLAEAWLKAPLEAPLGDEQRQE